MSRVARVLLLTLFVASCGSSDTRGTAPRFLDDACSILSERPSYGPALERAERRWGVPVPVVMAMIHQESKFIANARTPYRYTLSVIPMGRQSSAYGYSQALDGTWEEYLDDQGIRRARRDNIRDATDFMGWYMDGTTDQLGIPKSDARNQYLAYHDGRSGYRRGTWRSKGWLVDVSRKVADRAVLYDAQLRSCGRR